MYFAFKNKHQAKDFVAKTACPLIEEETNVDGKNPYAINRHVQKRHLIKTEDPSKKIMYGENPVPRSLPINFRHKETTDDRHFFGQKGYSMY